MGPNNDAPTPAQQVAKDVGVAFAQKYYGAAVKGSDGVMELFGDNSVYVGAKGKEVHGLEGIRAAISDLNLQEGKIRVVSINAAQTDNDGILVQSIGEYVLDTAKFTFSECFHLVSQKNSQKKKGWYVRSCLFKWHAESPEEVKTKEAAPVEKEEANHVLANGHNETKKPEPESASEGPKEVDKAEPQDTPKEEGLANGSSTPPASPEKKKPSPPVAESKPKPVATPAPPTSWAACVGGGGGNAAKSGTPSTGGNTGKSTSPAVGNNAVSDVKSPTSNATTNVNGQAPSNAHKNRPPRFNKKPAKAKSDFTVHVSQIIKGSKATEQEAIEDITKAFEEFGPIANVRVPARRLAEEREKTLYAFVDFQKKSDFENIFADREKDEEGRVKVNIHIPVLEFTGDVVVAQNHDRGNRKFYTHRRPSDNRQGENRANDNRQNENRANDNRQGENRANDNRQGENRPGENRHYYKRAPRKYPDAKERDSFR